MTQSLRAFFVIVALLIAIVALLIAAFASAADEKSGGAKKVTVDEADAMRKEAGVVILDVRTPREYAEGHIPGSVNVDVSDPKAFDEQVKSLDKNKKYLVHCAK